MFVAPEFSPGQIVVIGCGEVGLALAAAFARRGQFVLGVDTDSARVGLLNTGAVPDGDAELAAALAQAQAGGLVRFATSLEPLAVRRAFVLAVPTPVDHAKRPVLTHVEDSFASAARCAGRGDLIVVRSTVPIGTTRRLAAQLGDPGVLVAVAPDRSVGGRSFADQFVVPSVIGGLGSATAAAVHLFAALGPTVEVSSPEAAEAVKLFCNVQRDAVFALANDFAMISESLNLDFGEIGAAAAYEYPRFLPTRAGPVGGSCLTKDTYLLAESVGWDESLAGLALAARRVNHAVIDHVVAALVGRLDGVPKAVVAVLGLAFKGDPPTTDRRGSVGIALAGRFRAALPDADIRVFDLAPSQATGNWRDAVSGAHVAVLANDAAAIGALDLGDLALALAPGGLIYDLAGRTRRDAAQLPNGVEFHRFGQGTVQRGSSAYEGAIRAGKSPAISRKRFR